MKVTPILSSQSERQDNALSSLTKDLVQNQGAILRASKLGGRLDPTKLEEWNVKLEEFFEEQLGALLDGGERRSVRGADVRRKAAPVEQNIREDLANMTLGGEGTDEDDSKVLSWDIGLGQAAMITFKIMFAMFAEVLLYTACMLLIVYTIQASLSTGDDATNIKRNHQATISTCSWSLLGHVTLIVGVCYLAMQSLLSTLLSIVNDVLVWVAIVLYVSYSDLAVSGGAALAISVSAMITATVVLAYQIQTSGESNEISWDFHMAKSLAAKKLANPDHEDKKTSQLDKLKVSFLLALPTLFVAFTIFVLTLGVFELFRQKESNAWKSSVALLALGLKVAGNKVLLMLLGSSEHSWVADMNMFMYEYVTSLSCRVMQLSIPDEQTARYVSLAGLAAEIGVRVFYFNLFTRTGLRMISRGEWGEEQRKRFKRQGMMRVVDGGNDMIIEYLGALTAAAILVLLSDTGAFQLASDEAVSVSAVVGLCTYQLVPELFLDFYCTYMEVLNGLAGLHTQYWSWTHGAVKNARHSALRLGERQKAVLVKCLATFFITGTILSAVVKS